MGSRGVPRHGCTSPLQLSLEQSAGVSASSLSPVELPISTVIMLRSIMQIARSHGEQIDNAETGLSCLQVFALGAGAGERDILGSGYFAVRATLANALTQAAQFIAERGILAEGAPVLVRFISQVAARFGLVVTQKLAAQTLPVIGALGGAAVNYAFISHFQSLAQAHFTVRRLERLYGSERIRREYESIRQGLAGQSRFAAQRHPGGEPAGREPGTHSPGSRLWFPGTPQAASRNDGV